MEIKRKLEKIFRRYKDLEEVIADPQTVKDKTKYREVMQEYSELGGAVSAYQKLLAVEENEDNTRKLIGEADEEMRELAEEELEAILVEKSALLESIKVLLIPKDPLDAKNTIMEIRAGTGGEEAALFAADLFRMYQKYSDRKGWKTEIISSHETGIGGLKEIIFSVQGKSVFADLRWESGVHRVQRVPATESGGRIHTSAVTVAVLPEAEETDIDIKQEDLRIDVFRSGGPGGQSVNTTDSAVRITHTPSGLVVICQDEKSQHKNKAKALRVLRSRLYEMEEEKKQNERRDARRSQIGTGDRSERIRTYNYPQNRITDHRINLTLYKLELALEGEIDEVVEALKMSAREMVLGADV